MISLKSQMAIWGGERAVELWGGNPQSCFLQLTVLILYLQSTSGPPWKQSFETQCLLAAKGTFRAPLSCLYSALNHQTCQELQPLVRAVIKYEMSRREACRLCDTCCLFVFVKDMRGDFALPFPEVVVGLMCLLHNS